MLYIIFEAIENYSKTQDAYTWQRYNARIKEFNPSKIACKNINGRKQRI